MKTLLKGMLPIMSLIITVRPTRHHASRFIVKIDLFHYGIPFIICAPLFCLQQNLP